MSVVASGILCGHLLSLANKVTNSTPLSFLSDKGESLRFLFIGYTSFFNDTQLSILMTLLGGNKSIFLKFS